MPPVVRLSAGERKKLLLLFQGINAVQRNDALQAKTQMRLLLAQVVAKYFLAVPAALETNAPPWLEGVVPGCGGGAAFCGGSTEDGLPFPAGARNTLRA